MQSDIWFAMNRQRNEELRALAEQERLASLVSSGDGALRATLLLIANGLIASGQGLRALAQRTDHKTYQTVTPCQ